MTRAKLRPLVDILMTVLVPALMVYSRLGELTHEILGLAMLALSVTHLVLNIPFLRSLYKGRYTPRRILLTGLDILLVVYLILQPISGIMISKKIFASLHLTGSTASAQMIHQTLAHWGVILIGLHVGSHLDGLLHKLKKRSYPAAVFAVMVLLLLAVYGIVFFFKSGFYRYLLLSAAVYEVNTVTALSAQLYGYLGIMAFFAVLFSLIFGRRQLVMIGYRSY